MKGRGYKKRVQALCLHPEGGGYLLSHFRSTIGVMRFNFSVRNGKRWIPHAITTLSFFVCSSRPSGHNGIRSGKRLQEACRKEIMIQGPKSLLLRCFYGVRPQRKGFGRLVMLGCGHCCPCTCILSTSSSVTSLMWRSYLGEGFVLRCFQHLS